MSKSILDRLHFQYAPRTRILFGNGTIDELGPTAVLEGGTSVLLVTDPGIERAGHVARAVASLDAAGVRTRVFSGVAENPTSNHVAEGVQFAQREAFDMIVGLGGGSAMDCAKGINFIHSCGGTMRDYLGVGKATGPMLPMIAVPTTAGTGSESQSFALISDPDTHQKMACGDSRAAFRVAILDPLLTLSQPNAVTAATGIDALAHAVESFVTTKRTPFSEVFSREAFRLIAGSLERVLEAPDDVDARGRMQLGATFAGIGIENSMLGATHSAANPVTAHYGTVHGVAIGILLPHVVRYNAPDVGERYAELAALAGVQVDELGAGAALAGLLERIHGRTGLSARLGDCGVTADAVAALAAEAATQWTAQFNPRPISSPDFEEIYRCAL